MIPGSLNFPDAPYDTAHVAFAGARPFPHVVIDGLVPYSICRDVIDAWPGDDDPAWHRFGGEHEHGKRQGSPDRDAWPEPGRMLYDRLTAHDTCAWLEAVTGICPLVPDAAGGGYHQVDAGGILDVHVDFSRSTNASGLYRRLNVLTYLNDDYRPEYGGGLYLGAPGTPDQIRVEPVIGRTVIFATSAHSWHGHPDAWAGPVPRRSFAVYWYAPDPPPGGLVGDTTWAPA